ncbi:SanA/YdcF family protein [Prosthecobacter dejongeii]|uniref:SanA protein n=1 Tax=Prosthecobacter dejongeii TaxID=48465 RepID=A0A7W8DP17_9BACT|nr:ElyC/SanA/YdcF family protein [Prosthecobacter dejongeii]MBB5036857.1 SanA protein [Prosthecobacter dejongeii]
MKLNFKVSLKRLLLGLVFILFLIMGLIFASDQWVRYEGEGRCYDDVAKLPAAEVVLVLGCSPRIAGQENLFYRYRIEAAIELYKADKVKAFIVSGDNGTHQYDEPTAMKESLIAGGVPEHDIYCDYAGFRTLDSVVRAKAIFDQKKFIVVSQRFHNERAVFLALHHDLDAVGFNAKDVSRSVGLMTHLREYLARVNAVLDVTLLQTEPKFYGPKVSISR